MQNEITRQSQYYKKNLFTQFYICMKYFWNSTHVMLNLAQPY